MEFHGVASFLTLLSPFNIVFLFIKRSWIEPFMTFFVWVKFLAMGFSMCFFWSNCWKSMNKNLIISGLLWDRSVMR